MNMNMNFVTTIEKNVLLPIADDKVKIYLI